MVLEFYPIEFDDDSVGFVAVESEFEPWLIAAVGVGFEDMSYSVLEEDDDGLVELIIDGDDFDNLQDLYAEYQTYGWAVIDDDDYAEWAEAFSAEQMSDEDYLLMIIEFDEKNPQPAKPYHIKSSLYEDGTVPSMAFFLGGKTVNPKVMLKAIREGRVARLNRNADTKGYYRGINLDRFSGNKSNRRNFSQTRRNLKKDMFGSVSLGSILTGVAALGTILYLVNRK